MSQRIQLNRRTFLRTAGMTAVAGAVGSSSASFAAPSLSPGTEPPDGVFDFDEIYDRVGTDVLQVGRSDHRSLGPGERRSRDGRGRHGLPVLHPAITRALKARCEHENWGYGIPRRVIQVESIVAWNKNRHGVEVDPDSIAAVRQASILALIAGLKSVLSSEARKVLDDDADLQRFLLLISSETLTVTADSLGKLRKRPVLDRLGRSRKADGHRHQRADPLQPAEPDRERLVPRRPV